MVERTCTGRLLLIAELAMSHSEITGVPIPEAMISADVKARKIVSEIPHPTAGTVPNVRSPYHLSLTPAIDPIAAPLLGEHNQEILSSLLGMSDAAIQSLSERGAFGPLARAD